MVFQRSRQRRFGGSRGTGTMERGYMGSPFSSFPCVYHFSMELLPPLVTTSMSIVLRTSSAQGQSQLPSSPWSLGTEAYPIGTPDAGVTHMVPVLRITRLHSAIGSIGALRRGLVIASSYTSVRRTEGGSRYLSEACCRTGKNFIDSSCACA